LLSLHLSSAGQAVSPFAAVTARAHAADGTAASPNEQGTFSAHLALTLYDASGRVRSIEDGVTALLGAKLGEGDAAVVDVRDGDGDLSVTVRKDGTYAAVERGAGGVLRYDSRSTAAPSAALSALAQRAARAAGLASSAGTPVALGAAAPSVLGALGASASNDGVTVTITDAGGVSRYAARPDGTVSAARTAGEVALETVTVDGGAQIDAVRLADGSGTTTVRGGALGGTELTLTHDRSGTEHVAVTSGAGGSGLGAVAGSLAAVDAFGERITLGADAQGRTTAEIVDAAGTAFDLTAGASGTDASLNVALAVGGDTGTRHAELIEEATATTTTGSVAQESSAFVVGAHDAKDGSDARGTFRLGVDARIMSLTTANDGTAMTNDSAHLTAHADASGAIDVAGKAGAAAANGYRDLHGGGIASRLAYDAAGAASFDDAARQTLLAIDVDASGLEKTPLHPDDPTKLNSTTKDDASVTLDAFGRRRWGNRDAEIDVLHDKAHFSSSESA
jgi:hypothetical protein